MNEDQWRALLKDESGLSCVDALQEAIDTLADVIQQACWSDRKQDLDSMALSAYADGIDLLVKHGRVVVTHEAGRRRIAVWVRDE
jgi:hypothetical protein